MKIKEKSARSGVSMSCNLCDLKLHYRYTRDELVDLYDSKRSPIKPCVSDYCMDTIWLNYKLEDEKIPKHKIMAPRNGFEPLT